MNWLTVGGNSLRSSPASLSFPKRPSRRCSMNRSSLWLVLSVLALIVGVSACQPASPDTNRDASKTANANATKETLNPVAIEAEITRLENEWATAAQRHDASAVRKFLADDLVMTYPDGSTGSKT